MPAERASAGGSRVTPLLLVVMLGALVLGPDCAAPAAAHTDLLASTPAPGDTVPPGAGRLTMVFGGPLAGGTGEVVVLDDHGADAVDGAVVVSGRTVEVPLRLLRAGLHEVTYRVVSEDGHAVVGGYDFGVAVGRSAQEPVGSRPDVGAGDVALDAGAPVPDRDVPVAVWAVGAVVLLGLLLVPVLVRAGTRSVQGRPGTLDPADGPGVRGHPREE